MAVFVTSTVLGTYSLVSGGFNGSGATFFSGRVGMGYDASTTTTNYYSSGSSTIAVFTYQMNIELPPNAEITNCYVMANAHAESTSNSREYMCVQLYGGDGSALTSELNFKSVGTSNTTQTLTATTLPTVEQCAGMYLRCRLGYYGGAINGATVFVEYSLPTSPFRVKRNGSWETPSKVLVKHEDIWREVSQTMIKYLGEWQ